MSQYGFLVHSSRGIRNPGYDFGVVRPWFYWLVAFKGVKRGFETFFVNGQKTRFNGFKKIQFVSILLIFTSKKGIRTQKDEIIETIGRILGWTAIGSFKLRFSLKSVGAFCGKTFISSWWQDRGCEGALLHNIEKSNLNWFWPLPTKSHCSKLEFSG